ncbi:AgmX/PglI C-terminal domain-containing protein [Bdellovibrio sp. HCB337]|uniref:AgmX/PglI C-terminal domain-containing protein n=1 Tax=Bdellovibrio sp. HCB337 TaxID=3394358 RepID=UPI0039A60B9C
MKNGISATVLFFAISLLSYEGLAKTNKKEVSGGVDLAAVRKVVKQKLQEVQKCYTDLIIEGMASKGKVTASWDIDDKGVVQNLAIKENTSKNPALEGCVTERVVNWTFPAAEAGKTFPVSYPFQFGE